MAKATKHDFKKVAPPYTLTLGLNQAEAEVLRGVLAKIGGIAEETWRRQTDSIASALEEAGVRYRRLPTLGAGSIYAAGPLSENE